MFVGFPLPSSDRGPCVFLGGNLQDRGLTGVRWTGGWGGKKAFGFVGNPCGPFPEGWEGVGGEWGD